MLDEQDLINKRMKKARKVRMVNLANKGKDTYLNKEWLFTKSCIERLSLDAIAELCKVDYEEIWNAHKRLGIPIIIMIGRENWYRWVLENRDEFLR